MSAMSIRRWQVHPDHTIDIGGQAVDVVSREALIDATLDAVALVHRAGGVFSVVLMRRPTALSGEMVTIGAVVEWKDRTDARAQPEVASPPPASESAVWPEEEPPLEPVVYPERGEVAAPVGDGLDGQTLPEEDVSSIPVGAL